MRLKDDMTAHAAKLRRRADGYRLAGARSLASQCMIADSYLRQASEALDKLDALEESARRVVEVE